MSTPVVLVAGLHASARTAVVDRLLREHPGSVAVHHDLREVTADRVQRVVRGASTVLDLADVRLAHGCVTCTVREDLLPQLVRHAAGLDWDPVTGDRVQHLVFTGPDLDRERVHELLDSCLLTEEEARAGSGVWAGYDDPFAHILDLKEIA